MRNETRTSRLQDLIEVESKLDHQDYFTFAQAAQLMGVSRQYIYKLVKEDKLRASRISGRMSIIRRAGYRTDAQNPPL